MAAEIISKTCTKCNIEKPVSEFYKDATHVDGLTSQCKNCKAAYWRSEQGLTVLRRFRRTDKAKQIYKRYRKSEHGKENHRRLQKGIAYKEWLRKYRKTEKYKKYKKEYYLTENGKAIIRRNIKTYREKHPEIEYAHYSVKYAIRKGILPHPNTLSCSVCKEQAREYHHHKSYAPEHIFDVIPVCRQCHHKIHESGSIENNLRNQSTNP